MRKILVAFSLILIVFLFQECEKKKTELDVIESACKDFEISNPSYALNSNTICGDEANVLPVDIFFDYSGGESDCLDSFQIDTLRILDANGDLINGVTIDEVVSAKSDTLMVSDNDANATVCLIFNSEADKNNVDHILMDFHTENDLANESNKLGIRVNMPGAVVPSPDKSLNPSNITVNQQQVTLAFWDDAAEDGDIISMALNGEWVIENYQIFHDKRFVTMNMNSGTNQLVFYAVNEGDSPPNTGKFSVQDSDTTQVFDIQMKKYATRGLEVFVQ